jgi:hypothetical protein
VGSVCVGRIVGTDLEKIIRSINKVKNNPGKSLNQIALNYVIDRNLLNEWERGFCQDTLHKKRLSNRQLETRIKINKKILALLRSETGGENV